MGNSYVNRDRNLSTQKPVSQFQPGEKYHDDSGFMPSNARRWLDIIEWCDEATQLSILVSDSHLKNGKGEGQSINPKQSTLYAKFIPFVSRDLVSLLLSRSSKVKKGIYGTPICTVKELLDFPPFPRWTIPFLFNGKVQVLIAVETNNQQSPVKDDIKALASSDVAKTGQLSSNMDWNFISVSELRNTLALLRRLKSILLTGCQKFENGPIQTIKVASSATSLNDEDNDTSINKQKEDLRWKIAKQNLEIEEECTICMDKNREIVLPCSHGFCSKCASSWVVAKRHCPVCRAHVSKKNYDKEQWQLETWTETDVAESIGSIENKLYSFSERIKFRKHVKCWFLEHKKDFFQIVKSHAPDEITEIHPNVTQSF